MPLGGGPVCVLDHDLVNEAVPLSLQARKPAFPGGRTAEGCSFQQIHRLAGPGDIELAAQDEGNAAEIFGGLSLERGIDQLDRPRGGALQPQHHAQLAASCEEAVGHALERLQAGDLDDAREGVAVTTDFHGGRETDRRTGRRMEEIEGLAAFLRGDLMSRGDGEIELRRQSVGRSRSGQGGLEIEEAPAVRLAPQRPRGKPLARNALNLAVSLQADAQGLRPALVDAELHRHGVLRPRRHHVHHADSLRGEKERRGLLRDLLDRHEHHRILFRLGEDSGREESEESREEPPGR